MTIGVLIGFVMGLTLGTFLLAFEPSRLAFLQSIPLLIVCYGYCIVILVTIPKPLLSIIQIDETGISRSFLGRFWKLHISWDEMTEARYFVQVSEQMIFSKTKKLSNIPRLKWHKEKDVIFMGFSKKRYKVIEQYLQQPIVGMPDKVKERLTRDKK
ncbi:MAG: hypothetical protein J1G38_03120 [Clostridiales bacterium]|nr:hypothetical protein [Clostridiales bacterium]